MGTHPVAHKVKNIPERTLTISGFIGKRGTLLNDVVNTRRWIWDKKNNMKTFMSRQCSLSESVLGEFHRKWGQELEVLSSFLQRDVSQCFGHTVFEPPCLFQQMLFSEQSKSLHTGNAFLEASEGVIKALTGSPLLPVLPLRHSFLSFFFFFNFSFYS